MIGCILIVAVILFLVVLIKFRNKVFDYKEKIKQAKSRVRVEANTYSRQMKNSVNMQREASGLGMNSMKTGIFYGNLGAAYMYKTGTSMINDLANSYEKAQYALNELISEYNRFVGKFPNLILAAILKYKKEAYIDEMHLDVSTELSGIDQRLV